MRSVFSEDISFIFFKRLLLYYFYMINTSLRAAYRIDFSIINDEKEKVQKGTLFSAGAVTRDFSCCAHYVDDMIRNWGNWGIGDGPFVSVPIVPVQDKGTDTKGPSPSVLSVTEGRTNDRKNDRPVCK